MIPEAQRRREAIQAELALCQDNLVRKQAQLDELVGNARESGLSWGQIGQALGMTRQGARQRWLDL